MNLDKTIFRAYDIRGTYPKTVNEEVAYLVGRGYGSMLRKKRIKECIVGYDNRLSSKSLSFSLIKGITECGIDVNLVGLVTTPMVYFTRTYKKIYASMMVTASHNPKDDNGFKFSYDKNGNVKGEDILDLRDFIIKGKFSTGKGIIRNLNISSSYQKTLLNDINIGNKKLKIVIDVANGTPTVIAHKIFDKFKMDVTYLNDESDGNFPSHHPDPSVEDNMEELKNKVIKIKADVGLSFDGDGDRLGIVDNLGNFVNADIFCNLFIKDILSKNSNKKVLCDIKCTKVIEDIVNEYNGTLIESRTGASYTMSSTIENKCIFGVEYSGHIYFNDRELFPITSGIYAALRLLEILSNSSLTLSAMLETLPKYYKSTEIRIATKDEIKYKVVAKVKDYLIKNNLAFSNIDGLKIKYIDGWALIRASNTGPNLTLIFEFNSQTRLNKIKKEYVTLVKNLNK